MEKVLVWFWRGALGFLALGTLVVLLSRALSFGTPLPIPTPSLLVLCRHLWSLADLDYQDSKVRALGITVHAEVWGSGRKMATG